MKILFISTVQAFFRQRAGMFFVLLAILFGFMGGREHYGFALFFLTDPFGMYYLAAIWLVYTLLCVQFVLNLWTRQEYAFIYDTRLWSFFKRYVRFLLMALGFLQPLLYYGIYIVLIGRQDNLLNRIWPIFIFYTLLSVLLVVAAEWRITHPKLFNSKSETSFNSPFPRPVSWIYWSVEWLFREKALTFLFCKTGAAGVFICTLIYYQTDVYDLRLPAIGLSLGYLLNIGLSYELFRWENEIWLWNRSLPISLSIRFFRNLLTHAMLIIPETLIVVRYNLFSIKEVLLLYFLGLSILMIFQSYLYRRGGVLEDMMKPVLSGFVILTFLILYKVPIWAISGTGLLTSYYLYAKWYGRTEIKIG